MTNVPSNDNDPGQASKEVPRNSEIMTLKSLITNLVAYAYDERDRLEELIKEDQEAWEIPMEICQSTIQASEAFLYFGFDMELPCNAPERHLP